MSLETQTPTFGAGDSPPLNLPVRRFSVEEYHELIRTGILRSGDPIELLEGVLVTKATKYPPHVLASGLMRDALESAVPEDWFIRAQDPLTTDDSEPEPDAMVVRGKRRDYTNRHPNPSEIALVVEVSDVSLAQDRGPKKRLYARANVQIYWIVNLVDRQVEIYTDPTGPAEVPDYREQVVYAATDSVPLVIEGNEVTQLAVRDLLP